MIPRKNQRINSRIQNMFFQIPDIPRAGGEGGGTRRCGGAGLGGVGGDASGSVRPRNNSFSCFSSNRKQIVLDEFSEARTTDILFKLVDSKTWTYHGRVGEGRRTAGRRGAARQGGARRDADGSARPRNNPPSSPQGHRRQLS